jgi:hypothetical protein
VALKPDENSCKKCGAPVRYATISSGARAMGVAFDAEMVRGGGYTLAELEDEQGVPTGRWGAFYTKVAERNMNTKAYRQHDCKPVPVFDNRDTAPVLIDGVWHLIHKSSMKAVK